MILKQLKCFLFGHQFDVYDGTIVHCYGCSGYNGKKITTLICKHCGKTFRRKGM